MDRTQDHADESSYCNVPRISEAGNGNRGGWGTRPGKLEQNGDREGAPE